MATKHTIHTDIEGVIDFIEEYISCDTTVEVACQRLEVGIENGVIPELYSTEEATCACEYCKKEDAKYLLTGYDTFAFIDAQRDLTVDIEDSTIWLEINYCPMCGNKLDKGEDNE